MKSLLAFFIVFSFLSIAFADTSLEERINNLEKKIVALESQLNLYAEALNNKGCELKVKFDGFGSFGRCFPGSFVNEVRIDNWSSQFNAEVTCYSYELICK